MTKENMENIGLSNLWQTPIVLQLADWSTIKLEGTLEDVVIFMNSCGYPIDFMVLHPKSNLGGYPSILGIPCLSIIDAYIGYISDDMTISHDNYTKKITLYLPAKPSIDQEMPIWVEGEDNDDESAHQLLRLYQYLSFKEKTTDDVINNIITNSYLFSWSTSQFLNHIMDLVSQENYPLANLSITTNTIPTLLYDITKSTIIPIEID